MSDELIKQYNILEGDFDTITGCKYKIILENKRDVFMEELLPWNLLHNMTYAMVPYLLRIPCILSGKNRYHTPEYPYTLPRLVLLFYLLNRLFASNFP